jgi:uncharacterized protein YjbI with pentapeptide repeats
MANADHVAQLMKGAASWNAWRQRNGKILPDLVSANLSAAKLIGANLGTAKLSRANLSRANLSRANLNRARLTGANLISANLSGANLTAAKLTVAKLSEVNLREANLVGTNLGGADLSGSNLSGANLYKADLTGANLRDANLMGANLSQTNIRDANLWSATLSRANLVGTNLGGANLMFANLSEADLRGANLFMTNLTRANLSDANLSGINLQLAILVETDLTGADLTGSYIHGVSAWDLKLERTKQQNLVITSTSSGEPKVAVDNIEVAQFVYLLLHNEKIRDVIDTVGKKGVLLLGRFTENRIQILERLREKLRSLGFVPMVFNFDKPDTKDFTETVRLLANLCHFVIVDITNPRSTPLELQATVPDYVVPFVAILEQGQDPFAMFVDIQNKYDWVVEPIIEYSSVDRLIEAFEDKIVRPAEAKFNELLARRTKQLRIENI